jgi:rare lipoprotein A
MRPASSWLAAIAMLLTLAACSAAPEKTPPAKATRIESPAPVARRVSPYAPAQEDPAKRGNYTRGGLYAPEIRDSAPGDLPDVDLIPEPEVKPEPRSLYGNRSPYQVLGKRYTVLDDASTYEEVGLASFYGNKFHGRRTSNLEVYDMYAFTAAHKTLPLPSFARVTNLANGRSVVVRVNDRGPFHDGRIIDLSYAAAVKLGVDRVGTARVEVKGLGPGDVAVSSDPVAAREDPPAAPAATATPPPASAIDQLLDALPIAGASAAERPPQAAASGPGRPNPAGERFDMRQDGRTMTADEFDRWMRERRMRVATGKPTNAMKPAALSTDAKPGAVVTSAPAAAAVATDTGRPIADALTFQVASFAARTNAEHALAMLTGAGIDGARLQDAEANGRKVWRLRVGPIAPAAATELVARIQGLGFGQPQRVRE